MTVVIIGAGLAGLACARTLDDASIPCVVLERADAIGGTSRLSAGWLWRYRDAATHARFTPGADRPLSAHVHEQFDAALRQLEAWGVTPDIAATSNHRTTGVHVDMALGIDALAAPIIDAIATQATATRLSFSPAGSLRVGYDASDASGEIDASAVVLAGGGYIADIDRLARNLDAEPHAAARWLQRSSGTSTGTTLDLALSAGAVWNTGHEQTRATLYGRAMPDIDSISSDDYVRLTLVFGDGAELVVDRDGDLQHVPRFDDDWSDTRRVREIARIAHPTWYVISQTGMQHGTPYGTVADGIDVARRAGAPLIDDGDDRLAALANTAGVTEPACAIGVRPGLTHTTTGLAVNDRAQVLGADHGPICGGRLFAAGADVGGAGGDGYVSGLALGLVLGITAGQTINSQIR